MQDQTEYKRSIESRLDGAVNLIYALLGLAVIIAVLGIANTLGLSIYERKRELGLLRAVGMTQRQVWDSVSWESVIIAMFGTLLGLIVGVGFSWTTVQALNGTFITAYAVPYLTLAIVVSIAAFLGVAAAVVPAWAAARTNILDAIASE